MRVSFGRSEVQRSSGVVISFIQIDTRVKLGNQSFNVAMTRSEKDGAKSIVFGFVFLFRGFHFCHAQATQHFEIVE